MEASSRQDNGINYVPDGQYINSGENRVLGPEYSNSNQVPRGYLTLRSFPSGERNCYTLPAVAGDKYLLRMEIFYGNYDGRNSAAVEFDLYLGPHFWRTVSVAEGVVVHEVLFVAWANWVPACLVNTGQGTPFVSVVELRPLGTLYPSVTPNLSLAMYNRRRMGAADTSFTRYILLFSHSSAHHHHH